MPRQAARSGIDDVAGIRAVAVDGAACQREERRVMTAAPPEGQGAGGVRSLEVRWILRGELAGVVAGWFARFPAETTVLEAAAALVFALAPPGGLELGMGDSRSYAAWLRRQPRVPRSAEPEGDPVADV